MEQNNRLLVLCVALLFSVTTDIGAQSISLRGEAYQAALTPFLGTPGDRKDALTRAVNLNLKMVKRERALAEVERQASVHFSYSSDAVPVNDVINVQLTNVTVRDALCVILAGTDATFTVTEGGAIILAPRRQNGAITGKISEARTGEPLAGANIYLEGTSIGTASDHDGEYRVANVPPGNYTLVVRFVGYATAKRSLNVQPESEVQADFELVPTVVDLQEVVVTGAGTATEIRQLGNAISIITAQDLAGTGSLAIDRALSGKIAGVLVQQNSGNPAGGISVRLRGTSTILGSADPLYIVDGVVVNNDSPVLINLGGGSQNRLVDIDPNDIDRIEVVKGAAAAALYGSRANNGIVQIFTKRAQAGGPTLITYSTGFQMNQVRKTLEVNRYPYDKRFDDPTRVPVTRFDWQDDIFRTAAGTEQYLSIFGGTQNTRYTASGSYLTNQGVVRGVSYARTNVRLGIDHSPTNWSSVRFDVRYILSKSDAIPNGGLPSNWGALPGFIFGPNTFDPSRDPVTGLYPHLGQFENPVEVIDLYKFNEKLNRFIGSGKLILTPLSGLSVEYTLGYDTYNQISTAFIPPGTSAPGYANGLSQRADRSFYQVNNDLTATYKMEISETIRSTTLAGASLQYENTSRLDAQSTDLSPVTQIVTAGATQSLGESRSEWSIYGFFCQQTVGFSDRFFVTGAGRFDASSVFGENDRWQFYPKVSASYVISDEEFWKSMSIDEYISSLRLRAAFGESGGLTAIGPYDRFTTYSSTSYDGKPGVRPSSQVGSADIKPESQREVEVGLDLGLLNNRIGFEVTYYNQHTSDLLLTRSLSPSTGFSTRLENVGTLDNKGIEITAKAIPIDGYVRWTTTLTYASNKNRVDGIEGGLRILPSSYGVCAAINGEPLGVYYARGFARDAAGNIVYDASGLPVRATQATVIGDPNPDFTASFVNEVQIGTDLSIRAQIDAVYGNDVLNWTRRIGIHPSYGTLKDYEKELKGEVPAGYGARVFGIFENIVEDGSFVKLRELSISYTFYPTGIGLRSLIVSLIGRNLFSIDKYTGYDPETNIGGQSTGTRGFDFLEVPIPRTFAVKLTATL